MKARVSREWEEKPDLERIFANMINIYSNYAKNSQNSTVRKQITWSKTGSEVLQTPQPK